MTAQHRLSLLQVQASRASACRAVKTRKLLAFINDVDGWGLRSHRACCLPTSFYRGWDGEIRGLVATLLQQINKLPNMAEVGVGSSTTHDLRAITPGQVKK